MQLHRNVADFLSVDIIPCNFPELITSSSFLRDSCVCISQVFSLVDREITLNILSL